MVAHVVDKKKELDKLVQRLACLGVHLHDTYNGGLMVKIDFESSLLEKVKEN